MVDVVVFEPRLRLKVGFDGRLSGSMSVGFEDEESLQAGLSYQHGSGWDIIWNFDHDQSYKDPSLGVTAMPNPTWARSLTSFSTV